MTVCAVKWCHNSSEKCTGVTFHRFPVDSVMTNTWIKNLRISRRDKLWKPKKNTRICSVHFEDKYKYTTKTGMTRLRSDAVPTENMHIACFKGWNYIGAENLKHCRWHPHSNMHITCCPSWNNIGAENLKNCQEHPHSTQHMTCTASTAPEGIQHGGPAPPRVKRVKKRTKSSVQSAETGSSTDSVAEDESDKPLRDDDSSHRSARAEATDVSGGLSQESYYCNECSNIIRGFRYICVQCTDVDFCSTCEARGVHGYHYALRVPGGRPEEEISPILQKIREELCKYENNIANTVQSIKIEIEEMPDPMDVVENVYIDVPVTMNNQPIKVENESTCSEESTQNTDLAFSQKRSRAQLKEFTSFEHQQAVSHETKTSDSAAQDTENPFNLPDIKVEVDVGDEASCEVFVHKDPLSSGLMTAASDSCDTGKDHSAIVPILAAGTCEDDSTRSISTIRTIEPATMAPLLRKRLATSKEQHDRPFAKAGRHLVEVSGMDDGRNEQEVPYEH